MNYASCEPQLATVALRVDVERKNKLPPPGTNRHPAPCLDCGTDVAPGHGHWDPERRAVRCAPLERTRPPRDLAKSVMVIRTFRSKTVGEGLLFGWAIFLPLGKQGKTRCTLFYHPDILEEQIKILQLYGQRHPEVKFRPLAKLSGGGFLNDFFFQTYRRIQATVVSWDAADIMALGCRWNRTRRKDPRIPSDFDGGHSELLYQYIDKQNRVRDSDPRIKYQYLSNGNFRMEYGSGFGDEKRGKQKPPH